MDRFDGQQASAERACCPSFARSLRTFHPLSALFPSSVQCGVLGALRATLFPFGFSAGGRFARSHCEKRGKSGRIPALRFTPLGMTIILLSSGRGHQFSFCHPEEESVADSDVRIDRFCICGSKSVEHARAAGLHERRLRLAQRKRCFFTVAKSRTTILVALRGRRLRPAPGQRPHSSDSKGLIAEDGAISGFLFRLVVPCVCGDRTDCWGDFFLHKYL